MAARPSGSLDPLFEAARIRLRPGLRLVPVSELGTAVRARVAALAGLPERGALLVGSDARTGTRLVGPRQLALFETLATPRDVACVTRAGHATLRALADLAIREILEVESSGRGVSGIDFFDRFCHPERTEPIAPAALEPSLAAVRYGDDLRLTDALALAVRLYRYNATPASPELLVQLAGRDRIERFLDVDEHLPRARLGPHWYFWDADESGQGAPCVEKVYLSPRVADTAACLRAALDLQGERRTFSLKVGNQAFRLLRPDKIVLYFREGREADEVAERLLAGLTSLTGTGLPFATPVEDSLLVSRAREPSMRGASWRWWVAESMGAGLARPDRDSGRSRCAFALARARALGIDPVRWRPVREGPA